LVGGFVLGMANRRTK